MLDQPLNDFEKHLQKAKIMPLPRQVRKVLEIGCGDGSVFKNTDYTVDGYDINWDAIKECRKVKNYRKISDNLEDFHEDYDAVCLLGVMEHMDEDAISYVLNHTLCRKARSIYITVPNAESFHRRIGVNLKLIRHLTELTEGDRTIGHKRYYTNNTLRLRLKDFITKNRFLIIKNGTVGFKYDTSTRMANYLHKIEAIEKAALEAKMIGNGNFLGAEIYMYLTR